MGMHLTSPNMFPSQDHVISIPVSDSANPIDQTLASHEVSAADDSAEWSVEPYAWPFNDQNHTPNLYHDNGANPACYVQGSNSELMGASSYQFYSPSASTLIPKLCDIKGVDEYAMLTYQNEVAHNIQNDPYLASTSCHDVYEPYIPLDGMQYVGSIVATSSSPHENANRRASFPPK